MILFTVKSKKNSLYFKTKAVKINAKAVKVNGLKPKNNSNYSLPKSKNQQKKLTSLFMYHGGTLLFLVLSK